MEMDLAREAVYDTFCIVVELCGRATIKTIANLDKRW